MMTYRTGVDSTKSPQYLECQKAKQDREREGCHDVATQSGTSSQWLQGLQHRRHR